MSSNILRQHILNFSIFFTLFYVEIIYIGSVKIAVFWKLILFIYIILYIFLDESKKTTSKFVFFGYMYSLKNFISISSFENIIPSLTEVIKSSYIALLFHFFIILEKNNRIKIYDVLINISTYIILSTVPFLLNLISPLGRGYNLSIFGIDSVGFVGIFQVASAAAVTIAFALILLIYHLISNTLSKPKKLFYLLLILIGLWVEIQTYARTGFAILLIGGAFLLLYKKSFSFYLKLLIPLSIIILIAISYYNNSKALQMRISGTNIYLVKSKTDVGAGSGRLNFAYHALDNWSGSGFEGIWIGLGTELAKDMMKEDVGLRIYAHNGFVDILQFNGIIGLTLYILFLLFLIRFIFKNKSNRYFKLNIAMLLSYLTSMLFQGDHYFLADVIFALSLSLLNNNTKKEEIL